MTTTSKHVVNDGAWFFQHITKTERERKKNNSEHAKDTAQLASNTTTACFAAPSISRQMSLQWFKL